MSLLFGLFISISVLYLLNNSSILRAKVSIFGSLELTSKNSFKVSLTFSGCMSCKLPKESFRILIPFDVFLTSFKLGSIIFTHNIEKQIINTAINIKYANDQIRFFLIVLTTLYSLATWLIITNYITKKDFKIFFKIFNFFKKTNNFDLLILYFL